MTEKLLQFIWQFQYFNKNELADTSGDGIQVILPGLINHNQGPDFLDAKIKIGNTIWAGSVELHVKTSDWKRHNHEEDHNYNNVVLHVVWFDDEVPGPALQKRSAIPVFELQNLVSKILLQRYEELMIASSFIPCDNSISTVSSLAWKGWKERLLAERLLRKAAVVEIFFQQSNSHWEETFWWLLARNFGQSVNAASFEAIARSIPLTIIAKHKNQIHHLESLLFGQAGLLKQRFEEDYPILLQREYNFLKYKYQLKPVHTVVHFLRMRPGNFPSVRLAQLAALLHQSVHLFSKVKETDAVKEIRTWLDVVANDYWHYHYKFDEKSLFKKKSIGTSMIDNIIINTMAPVLFAYGNYYHEHNYKLKALQWLEETAAENNNITNGFRNLGVENKNACDSQALIELKNEYCNKRRCLECLIGNVILKQMQ